MITLVVPTRNRAHTLRLVAPSYFEQELVTELIFVDDCGDDDSHAVLHEIAAHYPDKKMQVVRNPQRIGASQSRNVGVAHSQHEYILFCDDDEYLEPGYARTCLNKIQTLDVGAVSGRRVYMQPGETQLDALRRFQQGVWKGKPFRPIVCEYVNGAVFEGDVFLPFTNAIILTRKELLQRFPFDGYYNQGNGYREETDYQMNLFVNDYRICVTNECHSLHLPMSQVRVGGQRTSAAKRVYWSVFYTRYFFDKYYDRYAAKLGLRTPQWAALGAFTAYAVYRETLRVPLYAGASWAISAYRKKRASGSDTAQV
jgi:glycosyltransferase involved in cell wall biosynthesis